MQDFFGKLPVKLFTMRKLLPWVIFTLSVFSLLALTSWFRKGGVVKLARPDKGLTAGDAAVSCSPVDAGRAISAAAGGRFAPVFPGWGHYSYAISTASDS